MVAAAPGAAHRFVVKAKRATHVASFVVAGWPCPGLPVGLLVLSPSPQGACKRCKSNWEGLSPQDGVCTTSNIRYALVIMDAGGMVAATSKRNKPRL